MGRLLGDFGRLFLRSAPARIDTISGRFRKTPPEIVVSIETLSEVEVARRPWAHLLTCLKSQKIIILTPMRI